MTARPMPLWSRALRFVARLVGVVVALFVVLVLAADVLSDLPVARRLAMREINHVLEPIFKGRITLEHIGTLHLGGVAGLDVRVQAPDGTTVIEARGLGARVAPVAIVASFLRHRRLAIDVFDADVQSVDVLLDADEKGGLKLAAAFEPAHPSPSDEAPGKGMLDLEFPRLTARHTHAHGQPKAGMPLDVDLDDLIAKIAVVSDRATVDVSRVQLVARGMPQGANPHGALRAHLAIPLSAQDTMEAGGSFAGDVGGIPSTANITMRGDTLDAVIDVPEVAAEAIRAFSVRAPIYEPAAVHAEAHGLLSHLGVAVYAAVGRGKFDVHGTLSIGERLAARLALDVRDLDLRAFVPSGSRSDVGLHADVRADTKADGLIGGDFRLDVPGGGHIAGQSIPAAALRGGFEQKPGDAGFAVETTGRVSEAGAPVDLRVVAQTGAPAPIVDFVASSRIDRLADFRRVGGLGPGSANVRIAGVITLAASPSFDAMLDVDAVGMARGPIRLDRAKLAVRGFGPLSAPTAKGTLDVSRGDVQMHVSVDRVRRSAEGLEIAGLTVAGLGEPLHASLELRPGEVSFQGDTGGLALRPLGEILGIEDELREGRVAFAADVSGDRRQAQGSVRIDADDVCVGGVDGLEGHLAASIEGRKVTGTLNATVQGVGTLKVTKLDLDLGGEGPLRAASWRRTWGTLELEGQADLAKILDLLPPNTLPFAKVSGQLALRGHARRDEESDVTPDLDLHLQTSRLVVAPKRAPDVAGPPLLAHPRGWQTAGVDVQIDASANGTTGFAQLGVRLTDKVGVLASLETSSAAIPYASLFASEGRAAARMLNAKFSAVVTVPSREIARLPDVLRPEGASGLVEGTATVEGTCMAPKVDAHLKARTVRFEDSPDAPPLDGDITATYDGARADVALDVHSRTENVLHAAALLRGRVADFLDGARDPPWVGQASAKLVHFPLETVAPLADRRMHGNVSGRLDVTGVHEDARASGDFDIEGLRVGRVKYGGGKVTIGFDGRTLDAKARLDQPGGFANAEAKVGLLWGAKAAPTVDPGASLEVSLQARHFRMALVGPFVQDAIDEFDGLVDADAQLSASGGNKPEMKGSFTLTDGLIEPIALGQEFHAVKAKVTLTPDGVLRLENASAEGTSGKVTASGVARLQGAALVAAEGKLEIAKGDALPLDVQGAQLGTVYGRFGIKATSSADRKAINLDIDVPSLHVALPEASTHSVQELDTRPPGVHVGVYASPGRFLVLPLDGATLVEAENANLPPSAKQMTVVAHLGQDVDIRRGTDLKVSLDGTVTARLDEKVQVTGQIRLTGGKLDVQGKSFAIETGTVTFVGDPANPMVKVTAGWTAEDGTHVFADYTGPLKTGKVTLRSEPARPQNEIVALILFGTADGSQATPYATAPPDVATRAGTTVGSFASAGLSKGLDKLTGIDITAKIDTSQPNARPEVEVQVAKDISLQLAFVLGTPPPGTNPDTTYATIDWRFLRSWSLETTFGNLGSSMANVVWQRRY